MNFDLNGHQGAFPDGGALFKVYGGSPSVDSILCGVHGSNLWIYSLFLENERH